MASLRIENAHPITRRFADSLKYRYIFRSCPFIIAHKSRTAVRIRSYHTDAADFVFIKREEAVLIFQHGQTALRRRKIDGAVLRTITNLIWNITKWYLLVKKTEFHARNHQPGNSTINCFLRYHAIAHRLQKVPKNISTV